MSALTNYSHNYCSRFFATYTSFVKITSRKLTGQVYWDCCAKLETVGNKQYLFFNTGRFSCGPLLRLRNIMRLVLFAASDGTFQLIRELLFLALLVTHFPSVGNLFQFPIDPFINLTTLRKLRFWFNSWNVIRVWPLNYTLKAEKWFRQGLKLRNRFVWESRWL